MSGQQRALFTFVKFELGGPEHGLSWQIGSIAVLHAGLQWRLKRERACLLAWMIPLALYHLGILSLQRCMIFIQEWSSSRLHLAQSGSTQQMLPHSTDDSANSATIDVLKLRAAITEETIA